MENGRHKLNGVPTFSDRMTVDEYFRLIKNKDIYKLLDIFADDATIYEPFSNVQGGLRGKNTIKSFFEVVLMATDGLQHRIEFEQHQEQQGNTDNNVITLVTFERGGTMQARFEFELTKALTKAEMKENHDSYSPKKIQSLHIQFIH